MGRKLVKTARLESVAVAEKACRNVTANLGKIAAAGKEVRS